MLSVFIKITMVKLWTKQMEYWSTPTTARIIDITIIIILAYSERLPTFAKKEGFVNLSVDMERIGFPDNYKVIFFAIKANETNVYDRVGDYTDWALIPPAKLEISSITKSNLR